MADDERIVQAIIRDLRSRKGLAHEWDAIDSGIKREIIREWRRIVRERVSA